MGYHILHFLHYTIYFIIILYFTIMLVFVFPTLSDKVDYSIISLDFQDSMLCEHLNRFIPWPSVDISL